MGAGTYTATPNNVISNWMQLNLGSSNANPNLLLIATQNWTGTYNDHAIGVWYDSGAGVWNVYNRRLHHPDRATSRVPPAGQSPAASRPPAAPPSPTGAPPSAACTVTTGQLTLPSPDAATGVADAVVQLLTDANAELL